MSRHIIIVAGGTGTRMGTKTAKQFLLIKGLPLMWWTLRRFNEAVPDAPISLVLHESLFEEFRTLEIEYGPSGVTHLIKGGAERFHSVLNGLTTLPDIGLVAIHDAVRPFPSVEIIRNTFETAALHGSAIPTVPLKDSIREISDSTTNESVAVNRSKFSCSSNPSVLRYSSFKTIFCYSILPFIYR